jgi:NADH dehydrogenase
VKKGKASKDSDKVKLDYKTKGMMAEIGKRTGVATLFGMKVRGFVAWWLWRTYYLGNLPTTKKKIKVMGDWTSDLLYKPDVAMIKRTEESGDSKFKYIEKKTNETNLGNFKGTEAQ